MHSANTLLCDETQQNSGSCGWREDLAEYRACYRIGENAKNAVGPVLDGVIGRKAGIIEGYSYSPANKKSGIVWDEATFREYTKDPKANVPGTKMIFAGIKDDKRIDDLIAFLKQFDLSGKRQGNASRIQGTPMAPAGNVALQAPY